MIGVGVIPLTHVSVRDPFWGEKLIAKTTENVLSAIQIERLPNMALQPSAPHFPARRG